MFFMICVIAVLLCCMTALCFIRNIIMLDCCILFNIIVHFIIVQTDRAAMLDEIVDYVKFLRLQVKVKRKKKKLLCPSLVLLLFFFLFS